MIPASIWIKNYHHFLSRPAALRLAMATKQAWTECPNLPVHIDITVGRAKRETSPLTAYASSSRLRLEIDRTYFFNATDFQSQFSDLKSALKRPIILDEQPFSDSSTDAPSRGNPKALFFRNLLNSPNKELGTDHMYQGVFYIASALNRANMPFVLVDGKISLKPGEFITHREALDQALIQNPDVNFVGISLFDDYFEKAQELIHYIRRRSAAFIAIGAMMPTQNPMETLGHLDGANFFVRGAGEEVVPQIMSIIGNANKDTGLSDGQIEELRKLEGMLYADSKNLLLAGADKILRVENMDRSNLDFSLIEKRHTLSGTVLSSSRGCPYHCFFCTSPDKGRFAGKTPIDIARILNAYGKRLLGIYERWSYVPPQSFGIGFYDDDFLSDKNRAMSIFRIFGKSPFFIQFIQTSINSFFAWENGKPTDRLDMELLDSMPENLFFPKCGEPTIRPYVYIGTENYVDDELRHLGKPYAYARIEILVRELSRRRIRQAHHFIVSNAHTTPQHIIENLQRICRLTELSNGFYEVLRPPIPHVVSFYSSPHYRKMAVEGMLRCVRVRKHLHIDGFEEFDYPLVEKDIPVEPDAQDLVDLINRFSMESWPEILKRALAHPLRNSRVLTKESLHASACPTT